MVEPPGGLAAVVLVVWGLVVFVSLFSMLIIGPWLFRSLRKLVGVAKDVDPQAWSDWGCPRHPWDMGHQRHLIFLRAVSRRKGINAALLSHPVFRLTHRLYWVSNFVIGTLFLVSLIYFASVHLW